ncbi:hemerythrin [Desulfonema ishimotonii]|uniref:Hemerythrin n=1 Tax=Desulfonema ishimotonii TaxID=45657 RepID=A0A401FXV1_9BACT|nr:bacteriohemerythrin [Desulfonema ishimotonii]GBC61795.1 hemerythrin [Desulfonema ishimotonii]
MAFFDWIDAYSVGIGEMDRQHQRLVALLNELYEAMYAGKGREALGKVLSGLRTYTRTHFTDEERMMRACGYPGYAEHRRIHEKMQARVEEIYTQFRDDRISSPVQVSNFFKNWLARHILQTDMKYAAFIAASKKTTAGDRERFF